MEKSPAKSQNRQSRTNTQTQTIKEKIRENPSKMLANYVTFDPASRFPSNQVALFSAGILSALSRGTRRANKERKLYHFPRSLLSLENCSYLRTTVILPRREVRKAGLFASAFSVVRFSRLCAKNKRENRSNNLTKKERNQE